jgi:indolepyruvate ferredoxin oxidoreductase beta subunit
MKCDVVICGVGGQGVLLLSNLLIKVAEKCGLHVKQSEIHGMSQRGGAVSSNIRMSNEVVYSPIIPKGQADIIISMEPLEVFRYLDYADVNTKIIVNAEPFLNISNYPDINLIKNNLRKINAIVIPNASNIVLAGAASRFMDTDYSVFEESLRELFVTKKDIIDNIINDLKIGKNYDI